jgi:hypothetical protein
VKRAVLGLPEDWFRVESWTNFTDFPSIQDVEEIPMYTKKNLEIPTLVSYDKNPGEEFWEVFPSKNLPENAETIVNGEKLLEKILQKKGSLTECQLNRGLKTVNFVEKGADCCQKNLLPACMQKNAVSALKYGEAVTDTIATWVKEGFAAGPFDAPH